MTEKQQPGSVKVVLNTSRLTAEISLTADAPGRYAPDQEAALFARDIRNALKVLNDWYGLEITHCTLGVERTYGPCVEDMAIGVDE